MDLAVDVYPMADCTVVAVDGEIDVYTAPRLREKLAEVSAAGQSHLVVSLEAVAFLDSTGLGVLVGALKRVRAEDGFVRLVCNQERLLKILRITGLAQVFSIYDSVERAVGGGSAGLAASSTG
jgi:anti-sigma B factor antagonist